MKSKGKYLIWSIMILITIFCVPAVLAQQTIGAVGVTANAHVDGNDVCKGKLTKCHVFYEKEYVWLNGSGGFGPDGQYFFAVLSPDGVMNPNDGPETNLSDDYDLYTNRTFTVINGAVSYYGGTHDLDDGVSGPRYYPNGEPPYIRLYPYANTPNLGGIYIMAVCSLAEGYPVVPSNCSYTAFRIAEGE